MTGFRLSPEVETELDPIWVYIARESGSVDLAVRIIENITQRFWVLAQYPYIGRERDDLLPDLRSFPADDYVIIYRVEKDDIALILHVMHGSRDILALLSN